jgi:NADPH2:quinone reductase
MRRIVIDAYGGPEQLAIATFEEQLKPGRAQILVAVEAAGVNYIDVYQRKGGGSHPAALPFTPGLEGVGRVRAVGEGVEDPPRVGQRVAWIDAPGSYAEQLLLPAQRAIPVPDTLTGAQALLFQGLTAQYLATEYRNVQPGDRVLVHAAAGGVGHLLVQWLKHLGAWVVGTVSSEEKAACAHRRSSITDPFLDRLRSQRVKARIPWASLSHVNCSRRLVPLRRSIRRRRRACA